MQIACKRFGCQKGVEVCYWTCKHRRTCKEWVGALEGSPGLVAITGRLESAAAKSGRTFEATTLARPARARKSVVIKPLAASPVQVSASANEREKTNQVVQVPTPTKINPVKTKKSPRKVTKTASVKIGGQAQPARLEKKSLSAPERKPMPKLPAEESKITAETNLESKANKPVESKAIPKIVRPKLPTNGPVYLLLGKNGKYKELRESDLLKEASNIFKDSSLRLVKGQYLVPQITFKPVEE